MSTRFKTEISKSLNALIPHAPLADVITIKKIAHKRHLRHLPSHIAAWLAVTTHIRHNLTDYDSMLDDGYDSDSARHFVLDNMNEILRVWGATRLLDPEEDETKLLRTYRTKIKYYSDSGGDEPD